MTKRPEPLLWLNDARGIYIPHDFAQSFSDRNRYVSHVSSLYWSILDLGPNQGDSEDYWMTWDDVLDNAIVSDGKGNTFTLYQDGDLWLIPCGMEWCDESDWFVWPAGQDRESYSDDQDRESYSCP